MIETKDFQKEAKEFARQALNQTGLANQVKFGFATNDLYVVWFSKTLQNWKALISTDRKPGVYVEVTYDGTKDQAYVDVYTKLRNFAISREELIPTTPKENNA